MKHVSSRLWLAVLLAALAATPAFGQGGATGSIEGTVVDSGGGIIPGATVTATNDATAGTSTAVSQANGSFTIPSLVVGKYTVTVALQGFKTAVLKDVQVSAGAPVSIKPILEVGGVTETVVVEGASQIIQTSSSAVSTVLNTNQIISLPLASRNTLDFIQFLPGVQTPGNTRDSVINGLPQSSINITVDGVSVQDNHLKTGDGFFARMSPRLDAVEEVSVTTAGNGADASGQGSTQIKFSTRSGSNMFTGSAYYFYQNDSLNTNTFFNKKRELPKGDLNQNQPGFRVGGPIVIPGLYDGRGKAFFFVNYEELRQPSTITTNSNFLTPTAHAGIFRYQTTGGAIQTVDLYALARANNQIATPDPIIANLLNDIKASTTNGGTVSELAGNFNAQRYSFQQSVNSHNRYPTIRLDYNLSPRHRLNGSWNFNDIVASPDTTNTRQATFPGFPSASDQISDRYTFQTSLRSTLWANVVNEVRVGFSGGATMFSPGLTTDMWTGPLANQNGYTLGISAAGVTNADSGAGGSAREASTKFIESTMNWLRGSHSLSLGGGYTQVDVWLLTTTRVPTVNFGVVNGDPAQNMFTQGNFPGSSTAQRDAAAGLYSTLVGRVNAINGTARLDAATGQYVYNGDSRQEGRLREFDMFLQDSWKMRPNLSLNGGVRYSIQLPFYAKNSSYSTVTLDDAWGVSGYKAGCDPSVVTPETCNLFSPGNATGPVPTYKNLGEGVKGYNTDWNNIAPSVGLNWTPSAESGWRRKILGEQGTTSFSGGWSRSFERHGMSDFTGVFGANAGLTVQANRNLANNNLGGLPVLFRSSNLGPPTSCGSGAITAACMPVEPIYPIATTGTGTVNMFDPGLQVPYSDTWTVGIQRAIGRASAIEVRYIGTRNREQWLNYNYNESNILDNGFLNEFKNAQANLYANMAAGRGTTFAYFGPGTNTTPLPIYLAYFSGVPTAQAGDASKYTSSSFSNQNFYNALSRYAPAPFTPAGTNANTGLSGSSDRRNNAVAAGLPRNFFFANPDALGGANVTGNGLYTKFNGLQTQFRRRLSRGLQFDMNYAFGKAYEATRFSFRVPFGTTRLTGTDPGDVTHAYKATFVYDLPFGAGKRYGNDAGAVMDRIIGGWQVSGTARVQSGRLLDLGNVRVVGMSESDVAKLFRVRYTPDNGPIYNWPQDIIDNTIKAYNRDLNGYTQGTPEGRYFAPANGPDCIEEISNTYGQCGVQSLVITGPVYRTMDISFLKEVRLAGRKNVQFRFDMLNAFDAVNLTPVSGVGSTTASGYEITAANNGAAFGRTIQLVARFNW